MSDTAVADEPKKDEPKTLTENNRTYDEKVTLRALNPNKKEFMRDWPNHWAVRRDTKKGLLFDLRQVPGMPEAIKGSVIIDAAGNEYEVTEAEAPPHALFVKLKKAAPKKDEKKP